MGVGRIFSRGLPLGNFSKIFLGWGVKSDEICFSHSKSRKQPFFAKIFKSQGRASPSDAYDPKYMLVTYALVEKLLVFVERSLFRHKITRCLPLVRSNIYYLTDV